MNKSIPPNIQFFEMSYGDDFPADQFYLVTFGQIASRFEIGDFYDISVLDFFYENGFVVTNRYNIDKKSRRHNINYVVLVNEEKKIIILAYLGNEKNDFLISLSYLFDCADGILTTQLNFDDISKYKREKKKSNINLVTSTHGQLDTEEYDIAIPDMDLALNYGEEFLKFHEKIVSRLNTDKDKGIIFLHGDPGSGKTTFLKYLTKFIEKKEILFVPPSMAEMLADPSIIPFLMDKRNSILLIEDGEKVISDRKNSESSSTGVSNLLNLTDGILGDCLNIQVIVTYNMKREKIDDALLRKGRLIAEHRFGPLSVEATNRLLTHLGKNTKSKIGLTLADIYNIDEEEIRAPNEGKKIGFHV